MKYAVLAIVFALTSLLLALDGQIGIHDPSTVVRCNGKYYTYGTGGSSLVSDDGWIWKRGTALPRRGLAPDVIHIGDRYYVYIAANIGAQPKAAVNMIWNKTLDPDSPDYKWVEGGVVASSDGVEDSNAIDPGVFLDPNDGRLWLVYGSYFGYIRLVQLDPKTGKRLNPNDKPRDLAINCEASDMIYHDGWYYLLATHGSCCRGADSGYNIRMGRAKKVTGPFLDNDGDRHDTGRREAVPRLGRTCGWPRPFRPARSRRRRAEVLHSLRSRPGPGRRQRAGYPAAAVERRLAGGRRELEGRGFRDRIGAHRHSPRACRGGCAGWWTARAARTGRGAWGRCSRAQGGVIPPQEVAEVSKNWPAGNVDVRMANYLCQAQQKWAITAVPNGGGYPGSPYFKITDRRHGANAGRHRGGRTRCPARLHGRARTTVAYGSTGRWHVADQPQSDSRFQRGACAFGRREQFRYACEVRSEE